MQDAHVFLTPQPPPHTEHTLSGRHTIQDTITIDTDQLSSTVIENDRPGLRLHHTKHIK
jgi:hypothetical protein